MLSIININDLRRINKIKQLLEGLQTQDIDSFVKQFGDINKQNLDQKGILENLLKNIIIVSKDQFIDKVREIIVKIQNGLKTYSYDIIEKNSYHFQQFYLPQRDKQPSNCQEHLNQQIKQLDLQEQSNKPDRVACLNCIKDYPAKYETLENAEKKWIQWLSQKQNNCNNYVKKTLDKVLELTNFLEEWKLKMIQLVQSILIKINTKASQQIKQIKDSFQSPKNVKVNEVSVQDLIKIAKDISNPQTQQLFLEKLQTEYNKWNEENDQLLKEIINQNTWMINQNKRINKLNDLRNLSVYTSSKYQYYLRFNQKKNIYLSFRKRIQTKQFHYLNFNDLYFYLIIFKSNQK